jgi:hypothetical protein
MATTATLDLLFKSCRRLSKTTSLRTRHPCTFPPLLSLDSLFITSSPSSRLPVLPTRRERHWVLER